MWTLCRKEYRVDSHVISFCRLFPGKIWIQAPTAASSTDLQLTRLVNIVCTQTPSYTKHLPFHISAAS